MKKKKYKYDMITFTKDYRGCSSGSGATYLHGLRRRYNNMVIRTPEDIHMIIRRPDNKLMNFYHPFKGDGIPNG